MHVNNLIPLLDFKTAFEALPGNHLVILADAPAFTMVAATDAYLKMVYKTREDIDGMPLFDVFPEDLSDNDAATGVPRVSLSLQQIIATKEVLQMPDRRYDIVNPETGNLEFKVWSVSNKPVLNSQGDVAYIISTAEDISEKVRLQEESNQRREKLYESERRFSAIINASTDIIYSLSADWKTLYPLDGKGFLIDTQEPITNWMEQNVHPSEVERVKKAIAAAITNKTVFELEHQVNTVDGSTGWIFSRAVPVLDDNKNIIEWFGTATDITTKKLFEQSLKESENRFRTMVEQAQVPIAMTGQREMIFEAINEPMIELIGKTGSSVLGKSVGEVLPELQGQPIMEILQKVWDSGEPFKGNEVPAALLLNNQLVQRYYDLSYTPVLADGKIQCIIHLAIDVTEQVVARQKIEEIVAQRTQELAQANDTLLNINKELQRSNTNLEEFAHAASHDLKEPVRKIRFFTNQLKEHFNALLDEDQARAFNRIEKATERMGSLIDDLLLYSHVSQRPLETETVDLNKKVNNVLEDLELDIEEKKATIHLDNLPVIHGYRRQLEQLFQNLIGNSLKYSKSDTAPQVHISATKVVENGIRYHLIEIKDNGIGFEQEYGEKIFQMFARLHGKAEYSGTGIGLSIVKKVVENHNGFVKAESVLGEGSVFKIYLPVEP